MEVTDDKTLDKATPQAPADQATRRSSRAAPKLVKLADKKICNLRDMAASPPQGPGPRSRQREYFDWARKVVDGLRGVHPGLERIFDEAYEGKP